MTDKPPVTIVGSGLAGALMACYLGKAGYRVAMYEKRPDPRAQVQSRARSINLAISVRGLSALRGVGLEDEVLRSSIFMRGRMIHAPSGQLAFQPYGKDVSESIHSISRADLNLLLINAAARYEGVQLHFQQRCTGVNLETGAIELWNEVEQRSSHVPTEMLITADGAYSAVRAQMQKMDRFDYRQDFLTHGYKELTMPAGPDGKHVMETHALHIWPRHSFMMIALPNRDGTFTCTLFWPFEGANSFAALQTPADVTRFFEQQFPDVLPLMPNLAQEFLSNPTGSLVTIRCRPWHVRDRVLLIGDAAHAVVPFLGQGMNAAFEDCMVLAECLAQHGPHGEAAFQSFEESRKPNTDVLADLCVENFLEMRDRVSSKAFRLKKRFEILLSKLFPGWYRPLYTMVSFSRTPYAEALRRARKQDRVVTVVLVLLLGLLLGLLLVFAPLR